MALSHNLNFYPTPYRLYLRGTGGRAGISGHLILLALYILLIMRGLWIAARRKPPLVASWLAA